MLVVQLVGVLGTACLLLACSDNADQEAACKEEAKLTKAIASNAEDVDGISSEGLCLLSQSEIAQRLKNSSAWGTKSDAQRNDRAEQYVTNCSKLSQAKADCRD